MLSFQGIYSCNFNNNNNNNNNNKFICTLHYVFSYLIITEIERVLAALNNHKGLEETGQPYLRSQ